MLPPQSARAAFQRLRDVPPARLDWTAMVAVKPPDLKTPSPLSAPIRWLAIAAVAAVAAAYAISLRAPFLFDDQGAIINNPTIRHLASWSVLNPPSDGTTTTGRPVVNLSFALNYSLGGETPWGYHALNIAIHILATLVLMGIVRRTLSGPVLGDRFGPAAPTLAFFSALLWGLHPLQTESVTCIAQRTESLCGLFYFLTLYAFIRGAVPDPLPAGSTGRAPSSRRWFGISFVSCLLGMGTKEVMVTAPVMVLLYDRTFVAGSFSVAWQRRWTRHAALAGTWLLLAWLMLRTGGARGSSAGFGFGITWWQYLLKQCEALLLYFKLSLWPHPLVLDYGTAVVRFISDVWWQGLGVLALLAATAWALWRKPAAGFAGACFFVILAPSSSIVPLVGQTMAEHRMYLPLAGIVALIVVSAHRWLGPRAPWLLGVIAIVFGATTAVRNHDYLDVLQIWTDTVAKYPQNARAHNNLAGALQHAGRIAEANAHFARAVALQPGYVSAHYSWGVALLDQQRPEAAITEFKIVVGLAPTHADAWVNLGNALAQVQREAEAVPVFEEAMRLRPGPDIDYDLGVALVAAGRDAVAAAHFHAALQGDPSLAEAHYQLARLAERAGREADAQQDYEATLRLTPDHAAAHAQLGLLLARTEKLAPARAHLEAAVRLNPADADALANLGNVLLLQGEVRAAIARYEAVLRLRPHDARARENLQLAREALR